MWNFWRRNRSQERELRWTVIAPEARGQEETMALRENADDLGAAAALQEVIESSRPRNSRELSSLTMPNLTVRSRSSAVSADSEDFIRNVYTDTGRGRPRRAGGSLSSPLGAAPPTQAADSVEDYVDAASPSGEQVEQRPSIQRNLLTDPVGTFLHLTAAATLAAGAPGRHFITSGPPPPDQRGRRAHTTTSQARPRPTPRPLLTQRHRAASSPAALRDRRHVSASGRSARSL